MGIPCPSNLIEQIKHPKVLKSDKKGRRIKIFPYDIVWLYISTQKYIRKLTPMATGDLTREASLHQEQERQQAGSNYQQACLRMLYIAVGMSEGLLAKGIEEVWYYR